MALKNLIRVVAVLFLAGVTAEELGAQGPGYIITDYGFGGEGGIGACNVDGSNVYNLLPHVNAAPPPGFSCGLPRDLGPLHPSASLDGSLIAFESFGSGPGQRVFVMNGDGTGIRQVTFPDPAFPGVQDGFPVISPDGTRVAFISSRTPLNSLQVFTVNVDGSGLQQVTPEVCFPTDCSGAFPAVAWSPDSTQLAWLGHFPGLLCNFEEAVKIINSDGTGERFVTCHYPAPFDHWEATMDWSPDGARIGFGDSGGRIRQVAPNGTELETLGQLGTPLRAAGAFRYSPDSLRLAYSNEIGCSFAGCTFKGISFINVDGTGRQDIINTNTPNSFWWQPGPAVLRPTTLTLAPDPLVVGPSFGQQLSPVLKDSAGNILSRSAYGYCTGNGRFARPDQLGFVTSAGGPATPMVVTNGGLSSNVITALPQATDPPVSINPKAWDFGNQSVATASATQVFTLTNTGTTALNILGITVTGVNASDFTLDPGASTCPIVGSTVDVAASCSINVFFTPGAAGVRSAQVAVSDDAAGGPTILPSRAPALRKGSLSVAQAPLPVRVFVWVPLDKSEGVVKRHFFSAMLSSTACISEWWRTKALKLSR